MILNTNFCKESLILYIQRVLDIPESLIQFLNKVIKAHQNLLRARVLHLSGGKNTHFSFIKNYKKLKKRPYPFLHI